VTGASVWTAVKGWALAGMAWLRRPSPAPVSEPVLAPPVMSEKPQPALPPSDDVGIMLDDNKTVLAAKAWVDQTYKTDFASLPQLLDQLPRARRIVRKLAKFDRHGYDIFRRLGARLIYRTDHVRGMFMGQLLGDFFEILPGLGLVFVVTQRRGDKSDPKYASFVLLSFTKCEARPWTVEPPPPDARAIYEATLVHDDDTADAKDTGGYRFFVAVLADRRVITLREWRCDVNYIVSRRSYKGRRVRPEILTLQQPARWAYPAALERHCRQANKDDAENWVAQLAPVDFGGALFVGAANLYDDNTERHQITCERDGIAMTFSIANERGPYFFRNRDRELTIDGKRARIFHAVDAHDRLLPNGKVIRVHAHYRGARRFTWNGEQVRIAPAEESTKFFDVGGLPTDAIKPKQGTAHGAVVAAKLRGLQEQQSHERGGYRTHINKMEDAAKVLTEDVRAIVRDAEASGKVMEVRRLRRPRRVTH
jgi:hypothetical protein